MELCSKHSLIQEVDQPTHVVEILDLVFTNNCELVNSTGVEDWPSFTDHRLINVQTAYQHKQVSAAQENQFLCDSGKR